MEAVCYNKYKYESREKFEDMAEMNILELHMKNYKN